MQGEMIIPEKGVEGTTKGMLDPTTLLQSGAAPGTLIFPPEDSEEGGQS
jgi:hypothetical protein